MADITNILSVQQLRAAYQRAIVKLGRQKQAMLATEAEVTVWEQAIKDAEKKGK